MKLSVALGLWQDRPPEEALHTAVAAEQAGYRELWIGEMATWDAFALATAISARTSTIPFTLGPLPVAVRDPAMIAIGAASVAALSGRKVNVALGSSSPTVVSRWHGRPRSKTTTALAESAQAVRSLLDGEKSNLDGEVLGSVGYRLRLPPPRSELTVAAFGAGAIEVAARYADRMVLNLLSPGTAAELVRQLRGAAGPRRPKVALWCIVAVDPDEDALLQCRQGIVGYLAAPGYAEMFRRAGYGELVDFAESRPHPAELLAAVETELIETVGLLGSVGEIGTRIDDYADAGIDELVLVPCATDADAAGARTLRALGETAPE